MSQTNYSHKEIQSDDILNRWLLVLPPPQKEQAGVFSFVVHDQHSDTQPYFLILRSKLTISSIFLLRHFLKHFVSTKTNSNWIKYKYYKNKTNSKPIPQKYKDLLK
jgi:hypothetical protein